jgi:hypothetical protein
MDAPLTNAGLTPPAVFAAMQCRASSTRRGTTPRAFSSRRWNSENKTSRWSGWLTLSTPTRVEQSSSQSTSAAHSHAHPRRTQADPRAHSLTRRRERCHGGTKTGRPLDGPTSWCDWQSQKATLSSAVPQLVALPLGRLRP